jgi:hypothetical protein
LPFRALQARGRQSDQLAQASTIAKRCQSFTCFMRPEDPATKTKENRDPGANKQRLRRHRAFEAASDAAKEKGRGVGAIP